MSDMLADLVATTLRVAVATGGRVDPTIGNALVRLGYDRDFTLLCTGGGGRVEPGPAPGWQRIRLSGGKYSEVL